jgi:hypothetical protein
MFYEEIKAEMAPLHPMYKFVAIKFIVFLSFWQEVVISGLAYVNVITDTVEWTKTDVAHGLEVSSAVAASAAVRHRRIFVDPPAPRDPTGTLLCSQDFIICIEMVAFAIA